MSQSALADHRSKVEAIAADVRARVADQQPLHIFKGGVHHFVPLPGDKRFQGKPVDISGLNRVLEIDVNARTCVAEPGVTFAELVRETLAHGLVPTVVPELEGITVGGAVAGCSVESMSYRHGGFHDSCVEYELVTGTGEVLRCSRENEALCFEMVHGSYGTLAILTQLKFKLVPAKSHVKLEYRRYSRFEDFDAELRERCKTGDYELVDAIVHAPDRFVVCLGTFVDKPPYVSSYRWLNIFYKSTWDRKEDYLTTPDYFFRYDTECHWLTKTMPPLEWKAVRFLVGKWALGSTNLIRWSARLEPLLKLKRRPDVVCDIFIPSRRFTDFWKWYQREYAFYPLWVIPYLIPKPYGWINPKHAANFGDTMFYDCAVYGKPDDHPTLDASEQLEKKTYELDGIKTLISRNHHTREQFWKIYDQANYDAAKKRLDPGGAFKSLYEKFHKVK
jgi:FAD/FMN-containing dehydrogenase